MTTYDSNLGKALIEAVQTANLNRVTVLLGADANPNTVITDAAGRRFTSALQEAVSHYRMPNGGVGIIQALLDAGADPNYVDRKGETALTMAARDIDDDRIAQFVLQLLIDKGARLNVGDGDYIERLRNRLKALREAGLPVRIETRPAGPETGYPIVQHSGMTLRYADGRQVRENDIIEYQDTEHYVTGCEVPSASFPEGFLRLRPWAGSRDDFPAMLSQFTGLTWHTVDIEVKRTADGRVRIDQHGNEVTITRDDLIRIAREQGLVVGEPAAAPAVPKGHVTLGDVLGELKARMKDLAYNQAYGFHEDADAAEERVESSKYQLGWMLAQNPEKIDELIRLAGDLDMGPLLGGHVLAYSDQPNRQRERAAAAADQAQGGEIRADEEDDSPGP